jgi:hypothetical protein
MLTSLPFALTFGLWFSLVHRSWWPIGLAFVIAAALYHVAFRYMLLAATSRGEVIAFRVGGVLVAAFLLASVMHSLFGYRVGL